MNNFDKLPDEILLKIFKYLPVIFINKSISLINKRCYQICNEPTLWREIVVQCDKNISEQTLKDIWEVISLRSSHIKVLQIDNCGQLNGIAEKVLNLCSANMLANLTKLVLKNEKRFLSTNLFENAFSNGQWSKLEELDLSRCIQINDLIVDIILKNCPKLKWLNLDGCKSIKNFNVLNEFVEERFNLTIKIGQKDMKYISMSDSLERAAEDGDINEVKRLISKGADVNKGNAIGFTPLISASYKGHLDIVTYLVEECQADVNKVDKENESPLALACSGQHFAVIDYLYKRGADVNVADNENCTPLYIASQEGRKEVMRLLIRYNADVNTVSDYSTTPLTDACETGRLDLVKILIEEGHADINKCDELGRSGVLTAASNNDIHVLQYLYEKGADINNGSNSGYGSQSPLASTFDHNCYEAMEFLISKNADVEIVDEHGRTVPMNVCHCGNYPEYLKLLVEEGKAILTKKDKDNKTALDLAKEQGYEEMISYCSVHYEKQLLQKEVENLKKKVETLERENRELHLENKQLKEGHSCSPPTKKLRKV